MRIVSPTEHRLVTMSKSTGLQFNPQVKPAIIPLLELFMFSFIARISLVLPHVTQRQAGCAMPCDLNTIHHHPIHETY